MDNADSNIKILLDNVYNVLLELIRFAFDPIREANDEFSELRSNSLLTFWTMMRVAIVPHQTQNSLKNFPVAFFTQLCFNQNTEIACYSISILGIYSQQISVANDSIKKIVVTFLNLIAGAQTPACVIAEAYNAIMDAFDDYYLQITNAEGMTEKLSLSLQANKRKIALERKVCLKNPLSPNIKICDWLLCFYNIRSELTLTCDEMHLLTNLYAGVQLTIIPEIH